MDSLVKIAARDLNVADNCLLASGLRCWADLFLIYDSPAIKCSSCLIILKFSSGFILFIKNNFWFWRDFICAASALWTTKLQTAILWLVGKVPSCMAALPLKYRQLSITHEIWGIERLPKKNAANPYPLRTVFVRNNKDFTSRIKICCVNR